jgi:DNA polymerase-3 subunit epsilon
MAMNLLALRRPLAVVDLETTGTDVKTDRIVEISVLKVHPDGRRQQLTWRVNPGIPIPAAASAIHHITDADVAGLPTFAALAGEVLAFLEGADLCGFNIKKFDLQLLYNECGRAGQPLSLEGRAVIDAMEIFHTYEPRDLAAAVRFYCGRNHDNGHSAAADVLATAEVLDAMLVRYTDLPRDVAGLHQHFRDAKTIDSSGFFVRVEGEVRFAKGKHRGQPLDAVARTSPDYLEWMLREALFDDTKQLVREALRRAHNGSARVDKTSLPPASEQRV